jgi:asparagine synthase (glutamine-hydrolysing)
VEQITGITMPIYEKCRFQRGVVDSDGFDAIFPPDEGTYRRTFARLYDR